MVRAGSPYHEFVVILIFSEEADIHARAVVEHIERRGDSVRVMDYRIFPLESNLMASYERGHESVVLETAQGVIDFQDIKSCWWRRPQAFDLGNKLKSDEAEFAYGECQEAMDGIQWAMKARWLNPPSNDEMGHRKTYQMSIAHQLGFPMPETLVTNNPAEVIEFQGRLDGKKIIYKPFSATRKHWRETRVFGKRELQHLDSLCFSPTIFQRYVSGQDVRLTAVGGELFAAVIDARSSEYPVDFRMNMDRVTMHVTEIPADVQRFVGALMKRLGLVYGAIDFRIDEHGDWYFLEINPAGQWLFVEEATGLPISESIADWLIGRNSGPRLTASHTEVIRS